MKVSAYPQYCLLYFITMHCFTQHTLNEEDMLGSFKSRHCLQAGLVYLSATPLEHLKDYWWGSFMLKKKCVDHYGHFLHNGLAWMDGEGHCYHTNDSWCCSGMTCPGKLHHFKMNEVLGNIYDYITVVVTFGDILSSLQKISLDSRNNLFYFSWVVCWGRGSGENVVFM